MKIVVRKEGPEKYVKRMKRLMVVFTVVAVIVILSLFSLCLAAKEGYRWIFILSTVAAALVDFVVYGYYELRISMGTVLAVETTDKVVHLHTKRKTFTYDVKRGCVAVKVKKNRYIGTFETQDSRDKFIFYRHAPFTKYSDGQFTKEDIRPFFAGIDRAEAEQSYQ